MEAEYSFTKQWSKPSNIATKNLITSSPQPLYNITCEFSQCSGQFDLTTLFVGIGII